MPSPRHLLALMPLAALCACATPASNHAPRSGVAAAAASEISGESSYGLFLAGQSAINSGRGEAAAAYFARAARAGEPTDGSFLGARTFTATLLAGDVRDAALFTPPTDDQGLRALVGLTRGVEAMAEGHGAKARALLTGPDIGPPHQVAAALLAPFAAAMAGESESAIAHPVIGQDPVGQFFANLDQGKLFEHEHRYDEAETAYRALIGGGDPGGLASVSLGALLQRRGRLADAMSIYDQALARDPANGAVAAARADAAAHHAPPPLASLKDSAAEALVAQASVMIVRKQEEVALAYLRLALRIDPDHDSGWISVGDILADAGDLEAARAAYRMPKPGSDQFISSRTKLAWTYQTDGDKAQALKIAQETLVTAPGDADAQTTLADLFRADERYAESAAVLDKLIATQGGRPDWRLLYMRAVDLQESDHWPEAERDLKAALKVRPDEPELLNFLGYSWIDRGEKLPEALAMVQKAVDTDPKSGAMIDSLGWAYYRMGDYAKALDKLEMAAVLEPGDPDVNNHLGDAYWRVGRKVEARYQWTRVLTLEPSAKLKTEVEGKLKDGLNAPAGPALVAGS